MKRKKGLTLVELVVVACVLIGLTIFVYQHRDMFRVQHGTTPVQRAKSGQRSLATAIEAYFVDNNDYPAWSADPSRNAFRQSNKSWRPKHQIPTFMVRHPSQGHLMTLTTPVSYISSYFNDPFAPYKSSGQTYAYWVPPEPKDSDGHAIGWIVWSPGPDGDYDLTLDNIAAAYNPAGRVPNFYLIDRTYDPTNGSGSNGDVYRTKQ